MTNKEKYKQAFSILRASGKIKMEDLKMKKSKISKVAVAVAALAACFVATNSICFAAIGDTWVEKVIIYLNGQTVEVEAEMRDLGDGNYSCVMEVPAETSGGISTVVVGGYTRPTEFTIVSSTEEEAYIKEENGVIQFCYREVCLDITADYADGAAAGTFTANGKEYNYSVTGNAEEYEISLTEK